MIEAVAPVGRVDAAMLFAATGVSARERLERRQKRMRWLGALHEAGFPADPADDGEGEDAILVDPRSGIAAALDTVAELRASRGRGGGDAPDGALACDPAEVAAMIFANAAAALGTQARIGGRVARHLLDDIGGDAVNGA